MELYRWQKNALAAWQGHGCRGIVQAATGTGKTALALAAMDALSQKHPHLAVYIVVPTIPLARQWHEALQRHAASEEMRPGFVGDGVLDVKDRRVIIFIVNSARSVLAPRACRELALGHPLLLICDECHHLQSRQNRRVFDFLTPEIREGGLYSSLGLSATPLETNHDEVLTGALGDVIFRYDAGRASRDGVLSPFVVCEVSAGFQGMELARYNELSFSVRLNYGLLMKARPELKGLPRERFMREVSRMAEAAEMNPKNPAAAFLMATYERIQLVRLAEGRLQCCMALMDRLPESHRILIFCERVSQAERIVKLIRRRWGNVCGIYHSQMTREARTRVLRGFREHEFRILVSCRCLDEGLDVPDADTAIVVSSSSVSRQRVQRLGRILRRSPGKSAACLYYLYIRESAEDMTYLPGLEGVEAFSVRYWPAENIFTDDFYACACWQVVQEAREGGYTDDQIRSLRACMEEGLIRGDHLLPEAVIQKKRWSAETAHGRNYWKTMGAIAKRM
ncbi:MAG: DEAD/DEAH box helicase family protein [Clostridia bacterium]|nr:DEAD/DEAH box helicase family protein [Clostridia bacterium]